MQPIRLYTSSPETMKLAELGITGAIAQRVQLLPLTALPTPKPHRFDALRTERDEIRRDLAIAKWQLTQFATGAWPPDAGRESGLRADIDALESRLRAIIITLQAVGGQSNG
jgi:hypothetical protein